MTIAASGKVGITPSRSPSVAPSSIACVARIPNRPMNCCLPLDPSQSRDHAVAFDLVGAGEQPERPGGVPIESAEPRIQIRLRVTNVIQRRTRRECRERSERHAGESTSERTK
jgi:hypothetical protein